MTGVLMKLRQVFLSLLLVGVVATPAFAQLGSVPHTFTSNTVISSSDVNANFSDIYSKAVNRTGGTMTGTLTSRSVVPSASNTYDLGSASAYFQSLYAKTSIVLGQTGGKYTLTWANPAADRAISIQDPLGTDVFTFNSATQTLLNKTLTAPVLGGTVTGTYTLGGTPSMAASGLTGITATRVAYAGTGLTGSANLTFDGANALTVNNTVSLVNNTHTLGVVGQDDHVSDEFLVAATVPSSGLNLGAYNFGGRIRFLLAGAAEVARFAPSGGLTVGDTTDSGIGTIDAFNGFIMRAGSGGATNGHKISFTISGTTLSIYDNAGLVGTVAITP